ncbi:MAG: Plug domain-containing protein, partial [Bacteroidota bacterium]
MKTTLSLSFFFVLSILFASKLLGQERTLELDSVVVAASKLRSENIGGQSQKWSTQELNLSAVSNVADLLQQESNTFIKSYGLGSLATSSIRGGSAGHTLVLWNGLPLQSPMLGLLDLSLLPLNAVEEVSLQKGGNTALWGSGAIGGTVGLNNLPNY